MRGTELARVIRRLPTAQPITDAYQATGALGVAKPGTGRTDQTGHLIGWYRS